MSVILGIDIGGSGIKGAPVDTATGKLTAERHRIPTPAGAQPDAVKDVVAQLVGHFGHEGPVGVTFPGIVQHGEEEVLLPSYVLRDHLGDHATDRLGGSAFTFGPYPVRLDSYRALWLVSAEFRP